MGSPYSEKLAVTSKSTGNEGRQEGVRTYKTFLTPCPPLPDLGCRSVRLLADMDLKEFES